MATVIGGYFFFQKDARQQAVARAQENLQSIAYALSIHVDGTLPHPEMTSEAFPTLAAAIQKLQSQRRGQDGLRSAGLRRESQR